MRQLVTLGLSVGAVQKMYARGRLHRVHRGVYSLSPVLTADGRLLAAVLACGEGAVLSHRSAADHLGIRRTSRAPIDVAVPRGAARTLPGIDVHRLRRMATTVVDGIPCTTVAQTLLDLSEVLRPFEVRKAITRAEQLRVFDLRAIQRVLACANGRRGASVLACLLADFEPVPTDTKIEDVLFEICERHELPRPFVEYWVDGYRADFAWPDRMVIAEADGYETHGTRTAFEKDRERLQELVASGWRVVPFTHRQLTRDPDRIARILKRVLTPSPPRAAAA